MAGWQEIDDLKRMVLDLGLPRNNLSMFGVTCPYCGKSDRIHRLDAPEELKDSPPEYARIWKQYEVQGALVVCTFCRHVMVYGEATNRVTPLTDL